MLKVFLEELKPSSYMKIWFRDAGLRHKGHKGGSFIIYKHWSWSGVTHLTAGEDYTEPVLPQHKHFSVIFCAQDKYGVKHTDCFELNGKEWQSVTQQVRLHLVKRRADWRCWHTPTRRSWHSLRSGFPASSRWVEAGHAVACFLTAATVAMSSSHTHYRRRITCQTHADWESHYSTAVKHCTNTAVRRSLRLSAPAVCVCLGEKHTEHHWASYVCLWAAVNHDRYTTTTHSPSDLNISTGQSQIHRQKTQSIGPYEN